jgi:hypothetical protein
MWKLSVFAAAEYGGATVGATGGSKTRSISVYRVWESMKQESKIVLVQADKIKSVQQLRDIIKDRVGHIPKPQTPTPKLLGFINKKRFLRSTLVP